MGALPAVVRPEVVCGLAADILFQHLEETAGDGVLLFLSSMGRNLTEGADVLATTRTLHVQIEHGVVHFPHDALAAGEDRRIVTKEIEPQVDVLPLRRLVADIAEEDMFLLALELYEMAQHMALVDTESPVGRANVEEEPVGWIAAQGGDR